MIRPTKLLSFLPFNHLGWNILAFIIPFIGIAIAYIQYQQDPFLLVDPTLKSNRPLYNFDVTDDHFQNGKSKVAIVTNTGNKFSYRYTISNAYRNPYAGVSYVPEKGKHFDLSHYDFLKLKVRASKGKQLALHMGTQIEVKEPKKFNYVIWDKGEARAFRILTTMIDADAQYKELIIPIEQFTTPDWWFIETKLKKKEMPLPDYSKVKFIYFGNCISISPGIEDTVELEAIGFYKDYTNFYIYSFLNTLGYFTLIGLLFYKRKKEIEITFHHGQLRSKIPLTKEEEAVFGFITSHYMEQELSIADIQKSSGYTENKISDIIKVKTGMNFKAFLNKLRVAEAKRMLLETDYHISEIAEKVGYGNVSHFNRVFKTSEGYSPNEYKKELKTLAYLDKE